MSESRQVMAEPRIIPPRSFDRGMARERAQMSDETLEHIASLLDDVFRLPGTQIRFGLDALIGLVPGVGDLLTGIASFLIVAAGWQRKLPRVTLARMMANIAIDTFVGTLPIVGDAFDVAWKSNRKNIELLKRAQTKTHKQQAMTDYLFLGLLLVAMALLVAIPVVLLVWMLHRLWP